MRRSLSTKRRLEIFTHFGGVCHVCGGRIVAGQAWEVEHVIPFAMGGADDMTNWRPVHARVCHAGKTKQDVSDIARAKRREARHVGAKRSARPLPGSRDSEWKRTFNNGWVRR